MKNRSKDQVNNEQDANLCIALGAGLGAIGAGTALLAGAVCPLCVVIAPALLGGGMWRRFSAGRSDSTDKESAPGESVS